MYTVRKFERTQTGTINPHHILYQYIRRGKDQHIVGMLMGIKPDDDRDVAFVSWVLLHPRDRKANNGRFDKKTAQLIALGKILVFLQTTAQSPTPASIRKDLQEFQAICKKFYKINNVHFVS